MAISFVIFVTPAPVAPFTGAWIEIFRYLFARYASKSHPSRVRGLKFVILEKKFGVITSRTLHGCVD